MPYHLVSYNSDERGDRFPIADLPECLGSLPTNHCRLLPVFQDMNRRFYCPSFTRLDYGLVNVSHFLSFSSSP